MATDYCRSDSAAEQVHTAYKKERSEVSLRTGPSSSGANLRKQRAVFKRSKLKEAAGRLQAEQT
ncbi:hypothetical protein J6590_080496 [Homalodisca vitripennis]|nr:hypothetical protein J6590_099883 [Homalodisca vitripennis]KAG8250885.1 hypothetical protein J6590_092796 [Homalodisca vitripennis]KAG8284725.1 hypothetical protein J6590_096936 [Homalodisca vitripennis]KAG8289734.1 hypothetical protein J6590_098388 [Homalodisca vitripennis]KAG8300245.1 hypothetical protein J6590_080496 [Homalodisca vitripennis]